MFVLSFFKSDLFYILCLIVVIFGFPICLFGRFTYLKSVNYFICKLRFNTIFMIRGCYKYGFDEIYPHDTYVYFTLTNEGIMICPAHSYRKKIFLPYFLVNRVELELTDKAVLDNDGLPKKMGSVASISIYYTLDAGPKEKASISIDNTYTSFSDYELNKYILSRADIFKALHSIIPDKLDVVPHGGKKIYYY